MEFVEFETTDGLTLPGLLFVADGSKKVAIRIHGNGSSSVFYDVNESMELPNELNKNGISLLKFNNRGAHIIKKLNVKVGNTIERKYFGCAYEEIKDCVLDIDAAVKFLESLGYEEFYLLGSSTGANKICVYNFYKRQNKTSKYVLTSAGDDTGLYYDALGDEKFFRLMYESKKMIDEGKGEEIIKELLPDLFFSYKGFYDIANPDGDYNCFPVSEAVNGVKISTKPLFRYFETIEKPTLVVYGSEDEFAWGKVKETVKEMKSRKPKFEYKIVEDANHSFDGKKLELAKIISEWIIK